MNGIDDGWRSFRLVPDDVLFFRDGKPSSRGADHYLRSLFPPHPFTLYGALRTRRLLDEGVDLAALGKGSWEDLPAALRAELGAWGGFGTLEVRGPWLVRQMGPGGELQPLVPVPADLALRVQEPPDDDELPGRRRARLPSPRPPGIIEVARFRAWREAGAGGHSHAGALLRPYVRRDGRWSVWAGGRPPRPASGWYLTPAGLAVWRRGGVPEAGDFVHSSELWIEEGRTGLGLDEKDRRAEEHMLYTFGFVRLRRGVALGFEARGTGLRPGVRVRLGGEGRTGMLEEGPTFPRREPERSAGGRARLAFLTPGFGAAGGYPPGCGPGPAAGAPGGSPDPEQPGQGRRFRLVAAVMGGSVLAGGWDLAKGRAKPLRRAIPAGSVFVVEDLGSGSPADLDGTCLSDFDQERLAAQGFGLVAAGIDS